KHPNVGVGRSWKTLGIRSGSLALSSDFWRVPIISGLPGLSPLHLGQKQQSQKLITAVIAGGKLAADTCVLPQNATRTCRNGGACQQPTCANE
ncbi:hypothetical protein PoMZ_06515, partial [Pyricularia oryzae]